MRYEMYDNAQLETAYEMAYGRWNDLLESFRRSFIHGNACADLALDAIISVGEDAQSLHGELARRKIRQYAGIGTG